MGGKLSILLDLSEEPDPLETLVTGSPDDFAIIEQPYLEVQNIPYFIDEDGQVFLERSWHRDLIAHLDYLKAFTLAAPRRPLPAKTDDLVPLEESLRAKLEFVVLPSQASRLRALIQLPKTAKALWSAVGSAQIVHSGVGGWPYPLGWLANLIAWLRGKKTLIIVESAPWRLTDKSNNGATLRKRIEAGAYERMARYWCSRADLSLYTQPAYLSQLHVNSRQPAYIAPASWVNDEDVLDASQAQALWDSKILKPVRFLFAGRLVTEKGVKILLEAAYKLAKAGVSGELHIIGEGPLHNDVLAAARTHPFGLKYFEPVPYGIQFLSFIQQYHAIVSPSLSDEQPRIVFDASARAVPILASDTDGLRPHVENGRTGWLVPPSDPAALAEAMATWAGDPELLRKLGMEALARVRGQTHQAMHAERSRIIARHFGV